MDLELNGDLFIEDTDMQLKDLQGFKYRRTNNEDNYWYKLGTVNNLKNQGSGAIIKCVFGAGQNGLSNQNLFMNIILKRGWTGGGVAQCIGCTYIIYKMANEDNLDNYKVKVITTDSTTSCDVWVKGAGSYSAVDYSAEGDFESFIPSDDKQSTEPSYGYSQQVKGGHVAWSPQTIYSGTLRGTESVTLNNTKRFLKVYATGNNRSNGVDSIIYEIDTSLNNMSYGGGIVIAWDENAGLDYYVSESSFNKNNNVFTHTRIGFFKIGTGTYTSRPNNDGYKIYRIDTYD